MRIEPTMNRNNPFLKNFLSDDNVDNNEKNDKKGSDKKRNGNKREDDDIFVEDIKELNLYV